MNALNVCPNATVPIRMFSNKCDASHKHPNEAAGERVSIISEYCYFCMHDAAIFRNLTVSAKEIFRGRFDDPCVSEGNVDSTLLRKFEGEPLGESNVSAYENVRSEILAIDIEEALGGIDIDVRLNAVHRESVLQLVRDNYLNWSDIPETSHDFEMEIRLTSDVPFHFAPRLLSAYDRNGVFEMISDLQSQGIVRPSDSPYASPIVLVKKKDGSMQMCVDYRALNKITMGDNYPR